MFSTKYSVNKFHSVDETVVTHCYKAAIILPFKNFLMLMKQKGT